MLQPIEKQYLLFLQHQLFLQIWLYLIHYYYFFILSFPFTVFNQRREILLFFSKQSYLNTRIPFIFFTRLRYFIYKNFFLFYNCFTKERSKFLLVLITINITTSSRFPKENKRIAFIVVHSITISFFFIEDTLKSFNNCRRNQGTNQCSMISMRFINSCTNL